MPEIRPVAVSTTGRKVSTAEVKRDIAPAAVPVGLRIELTAAVIAVMNDEPVVRTVSDQADRTIAPRLPSTVYEPSAIGLEQVLRAGVLAQTGLGIDHVEQLRTFAEFSGGAGGNLKQRAGDPAIGQGRIAIGYLALAHAQAEAERPGTRWNSFYQYFPWEDWRRGKPTILGEVVEPCLAAWAVAPRKTGDDGALNRHDRVRIAFGLDGGGWDEEKVVERFDLLDDAGLIEESRLESRNAADFQAGGRALGMPLARNHREMLAIAMSWLRAKIKYRPVIFDLMPDEFTLYELQRSVEAILGPHLHKQNFRRLVETMGLVEPTGELKTHTGGRPAKLFRFRRDVLLERLQPGVRVRGSRL